MQPRTLLTRPHSCQDVHWYCLSHHFLLLCLIHFPFLFFLHASPSFILRSLHMLPFSLPFFPFIPFSLLCHSYPLSPPHLLLPSNSSFLVILYLFPSVSPEEQCWERHIQLLLWWISGWLTYPSLPLPPLIHFSLTTSPSSSSFSPLSVSLKSAASFFLYHIFFLHQLPSHFLAFLIPFFSTSLLPP